MKNILIPAFDAKSARKELPMSKRVLILSSSLREHSNSDMMADAFAEGARAAGHDVEKIRLSGKEIRFCQGCLACQNTKRCVIHDDADDIVQNHMLGADEMCIRDRNRRALQMQSPSLYLYLIPTAYIGTNRPPSSSTKST